MPFKPLFILLFAAVLAAPARAQDDVRPFSIGEVTTFSSAVLSEQRTLNIYLPEEYTKEDTAHYPVTYLLDGSANEDFVHICGLVQFFRLCQLMPPTIVVGIANVDRKRDFTFPTTVAKDKQDFPSTGGSAKFIAFLEKELQPFIDKHYRTNTSRSIIGQSLGGLLATEVLLRKPGLFNRYLIVSPSLWWDHESLLSIRPEAVPEKTTVYIAVGKEGKAMEKDARQLADKLGKNPALSVDFTYFPGEDHATILHEAVYKAFRLWTGRQ